MREGVWSTDSGERGGVFSGEGVWSTDSGERGGVFSEEGVWSLVKERLCLNEYHMTIT